VSGGQTLELSRYARQKAAICEFDFGPYYQLSQVADVVRANWMAQSILRVTHSKPFFAACGIVKQHLPAIVPQQFFNLYPESSLFYPPEVLDATHHTKATNADPEDLGRPAGGSMHS
jgi:hypothetical protein